MINAEHKDLFTALAKATFPDPSYYDRLGAAVFNSLSTEPVGRVNALLPILLEMGDWARVAQVLLAVARTAPDDVVVQLERSVVSKVKGLHCSEEPPQSANPEQVSGPVNFILGATLWLLYLGELTAATDLPCVREIQDALKDICTSLHYDEQCYGQFVAENLESGPMMRKYETAISKAMNAYVVSVKSGKRKEWLQQVAEAAYPVRHAMTYRLSFLLIRRMAYATVDRMDEVEFLKAVAYAQ